MKTKQEHEKLFKELSCEANVRMVSMHNPKKLFELLLKKCSEEEIYSVRELAASMNVQYEEIQAVAASDKSFSEMLELCREFCYSRAVTAGFYKKLEFKKTIKYMAENDDDFKVPDDFKIEDYDDLPKRNDVEDAISELYT